jgi:hypothetical protein
VKKPLDKGHPHVSRFPVEHGIEEPLSTHRVECTEEHAAFGITNGFRERCHARVAVRNDEDRGQRKAIKAAAVRGDLRSHKELNPLDPATASCGVG